MIKNLSTTFKIIVATLTISTVLMSCMKDNDNVPAPSISGLNVIHASPTTEKLDFLVDNTIANLAELAYTTKIGYLNLYSGSRQLSVVKKGSSTPIVSQKFSLEPQTAYSLFVIGKIDTAKLILLKDSASAPAAGKAKVRFVNLSPDATALNLAIAGSTTDLFTNRAYKQFTTFESVDAAEKVTFNVKNTTTGAIETALVDTKLESGKIYTIWVKGLKAATDDTKLGVAVFTHTN